MPKYTDPTGLAIVEKNDLFTLTFGRSAFSSSTPSVFRRPKSCRVLSDLILVNKLKSKMKKLLMCGGCEIQCKEKNVWFYQLI